MVRCPECKTELSKPKKTWTYGRFEVESYSCSNCGTNFREYTHAGKHSFTLKRAKKHQGGFIKA